MKKIQILLAALVAVVMCSFRFKTEATVDIKVVRNGQQDWSLTTKLRSSSAPTMQMAIVTRSSVLQLRPETN